MAPALLEPHQPCLPPRCRPPHPEWQPPQKMPPPFNGDAMHSVDCSQLPGDVLVRGGVRGCSWPSLRLSLKTIEAAGSWHEPFHLSTVVQYPLMISAVVPRPIGACHAPAGGCRWHCRAGWLATLLHRPSTCVRACLLQRLFRRRAARGWATWRPSATSMLSLTSEGCLTAPCGAAHCLACWRAPGGEVADGARHGQRCRAFQAARTPAPCSVMCQPQLFAAAPAARRTWPLGLRPAGCAATGARTHLSTCWRRGEGGAGRAGGCTAGVGAGSKGCLRDAAQLQPGRHAAAVPACTSIQPVPQCACESQPASASATAMPRSEFVVNIMSDWFIEAANYCCGAVGRLHLPPCRAEEERTGGGVFCLPAFLL